MKTPKNYSNYNNRMKQSLLDKVFFMDKVFDVDCIIDFGCADGSLIKFCNSINSNIQYIGYDIDEAMIVEAISKEAITLNEFFTNDWNAVIGLASHYKNILVVMSSVCHEIYSYNPDNYTNTFNQISELNPKYIAIREMCFDTKPYLGDSQNWYKVYNKLTTEKTALKQLEDFFNLYGVFDKGNNFIHFLSKYRYIENWNKELHENYSPFRPVDYYRLFPNYKPIYENWYLLPYLQHIVKKDFDIILDPLSYKSHYQIIFENK